MLSRRQAGFSLLELMIVIAIMAAAAGVSMPMMARMYDAMQYRDAVRSVIASAKGARFSALSSGQPVDLILNPRSREVHINKTLKAELPETLSMKVTSAREVNLGDDRAVIRFYPNGSSTGGDIRLEHESGRGLQIKVDWLFGRVSQFGLEDELQ